MHRRTAVAALLAMLTVTPAHADEAIWSTLKQGGKVVLMRHAAVDRSSGNPVLRTPGNCSKELNLSKLGREQAKKAGEMFRVRGIPVGDVLVSPYCRTMDTARIAFGKVTSSGALRLIEGIGAQETERVTAQAMKLAGEYKGTANLVLVTHQPNIEAIALESVGPAGMLVLQPKGNSNFEVLGRILAPSARSASSR